MPEPLVPDATGQPLLSAARVEDVFAATEELRAAEFPNVPAQLLADVLAAERDNLDNRPAAARAVGRVVDGYLISAPAPTFVSTGEPAQEGDSA
ncbi:MULTISPECIES: hypothetical protein [Micromonospora]|uniref:hypothetical protein n=1 Tax=Micromonospora TaxID=1873 RepID=UPI0033E3C6EF